MKSPRAALVATAVPLLLTSLRVTAGELPFNTPTTGEARQSAPLLHQTARVLNDSYSGISNLWLFPTADAHTVFARYNLTSAGSTTEHLTVLTLRDNEIVESRELTNQPDSRELTDQTDSRELTKQADSQDLTNQPESQELTKQTESRALTKQTAGSVSKGAAALDWSAAIGTGYAAHAERTNPSHGVPASPHWTAAIGTGTAANSTTGVSDTQQPASSGSHQVVAAVPHWTSRIGRGDAVESSRTVVKAPLANAR